MLIEESVLGWKEYEMEVVRDRADNCIIICSIENVDPMGVHTGDSITVAPALTLTDREYQIMRNASIAVLREIGVETGGSNVQFAVNPADGRLVVIEMNPRVSRSSALASKATGFPIAKVAAKLAVGYTLDELMNDITGVTPASFEPTIDYVVTKIPRFAFENFRCRASADNGDEIGRRGHGHWPQFSGILQKALRSLETGLNGLNTPEGAPMTDESGDMDELRAALTTATPSRLLMVAHALRQNLSVDEVCALSHFDPWFVRQIKEIVDTEALVAARGLPDTPEAMRHVKAMGFSDARLGELSGTDEDTVRAARHKLYIRPYFRRIDTCAAEFAAGTPYLYSSYDEPSPFAPQAESEPTRARRPLFWAAGRTASGKALNLIIAAAMRPLQLDDADIESIMVNCNPETVSTDYDTSDRLYFEPLTQEDVLELLACEMAAGELLGVIVQFGGQTPLKLSQALERAGIPILGTSPDAIDLAEDRDRFKDLLDRLDLKQPPMALPAVPRKPTPLPPISAFRLSSGRLMCWADGQWKLFPAMPSLTAICARR